MLSSVCCRFDSSAGFCSYSRFIHSLKCFSTRKGQHVPPHLRGPWPAWLGAEIVVSEELRTTRSCMTLTGRGSGCINEVNNREINDCSVESHRMGPNFGPDVEAGLGAPRRPRACPTCFVPTFILQDAADRRPHRHTLTVTARSRIVHPKVIKLEAAD